MTFDEVLSQVQDLRQREQRVSYRGLKRRFALDDEYLEDLKEELIGGEGNGVESCIINTLLGQSKRQRRKMLD
jgi:hypothetical protein